MRKLETPFFGQSLFVAGRRAAEIVGPKIASILQSRTRSPQFIQHALCTTNIRLKLIAQGGINWRFEPQLRTTFEYGGRSYTIKPDGLSLTPAGLVALECDMGHQSMARLKQKILAYEAFVYSGVCAERWECEWFNLLFVTTGRLRASRIARLQSDHSPFDLVCRAHEDLGVPFAGGWS